MAEQSFDEKQLEALSKEHGFTEINERVETQRCDADIMYALFRRPESVAPKLLSGFRDLILKKYEPDLAESSKFCDAMSFLLEDPRAQTCAKIFYILFILNREEEACEVIRTSYATTATQSLWGKHDGATHFGVFLGHLKNLVDGTLRFPYGETNIDHIMHWFVRCAEVAYLSK